VKILITHECSGVTRRAFLKRYPTANVRSCDLKPAEDGSPYHLQMDALEAMALLLDGEPWDLIIMHPDCTYLTVSGLHHNKHDPARAAKTEAALQHVADCMETASKYSRGWALENPVSCISSQIRQPHQIIQPHEFGDDASKRTCLWLCNLPVLMIDPAKRFPGRWVTHNGKRVERWSNQTDSGQNRLGPSPTRAADRSRTYSGIADAMAAQWGTFILNRYYV
jgi:hypothetical protein